MKLHDTAEEIIVPSLQTPEKKLFAGIVILYCSCRSIEQGVVSATEPLRLIRTEYFNQLSISDNRLTINLTSLSICSVPSFKLTPNNLTDVQNVQARQAFG